MPAAGDEDLASNADSATSAGDWQVAVCVLRYQHTPRFCTLWVAGGESLEAFCTRAVGLLARAGIAEDFTLVDPSPFPDMVTFVVSPKCWLSLGRTICVVAWPPAAAPPFAEVADCDTTLDDFFSALPLRFGASLDVFVDGPDPPISASDTFHPPNGSLISICREGEPPSVLCRSASLLADPGRSTADEDLPRAQDGDGVWLLLGPFFEPTLLRLTDQPVTDQIAFACGAPVSEVLLWHCDSDFSHGAVHGCACEHYVGVRRRGDCPQANLLQVVFLDPRAVGLPFDSLGFPPTKARVSLEELWGCLDLPAAEGYRLHVWLNESAAEAQWPLPVRSCDAWTLRLLPFFPSAGIGHGDERAPSPPADESDASSFLHASRSGLPRSRTPRRARRPVGGTGSSSRSGRATGTCVLVDGAASETVGADAPRHATPAAVDGDVKMTATERVCATGPVGSEGCRPLPTPCRARHVVPCLESAPEGSLDTSVLTTALELADAHLDGVCGLAVRVMQSALDCGEAPYSGGNSSMLGQVPVVLSLADHVGPLTFDLASQQMPLGRDIDAAFAFLRPWPFELEFCIPPDLPLHPATRAVFCDLLPTLDHTSHVLLDEVQVFTDGSYDGVASGWSVVIVGLCAGSVQWLRWFTGRVCVEAGHSLWLGAEQHGAQEAELSALCFALAWVLSMCRLDHLGLLSDSLVSLQRACGHWQFPPDHVLAQSCRSLSQAVEALNVQPWRSFCHVRAHRGQHWNEFADVLAKSAVASDPGFTFHLDLGAWVRDKALDSL